MKYAILIILCLAIAVSAQLPVGTTRTSIVTDGSGNVINNPVAFSNQVTMYIAATNVNQLVRFQELTNSLYAVTNQSILIQAVTNTTSTVGFLNLNTSAKIATLSNPNTLLPGSWTNAINFTVGGTNNANAYAVKGQLGRTGQFTNMVGSGLSNVFYYSEGILTNVTLIP